MNLVRTVATCLVIMGGCNQSGDPPPGLTVGTLSHQSEPASDLPEGAIVLESIGYLLGDEDATPRDGSLVGLPFEAVQQITGSDVAIETRAQTLGENAPTLVNTRVWRVGPNTSRITNVDIAWLQGERARLGVLDDGDPKHLTAPSHERSVVFDDEGRTLMYVRFFPEVEPDAPRRVDWTSIESRQDPRKSLLRAEAERQELLSTLAEFDREHVIEQTDCLWGGRTKAAHAAYLWCRDPGSLNVLSSIQESAPVTEGTTTLRGDDFRAATGMQNGLLIQQEFDGETPRPSTGRSDVEVAIIDLEGFFKPQLHPAYNDTSSSTSTRIRRRRTCSDSACTNTSGSTTGSEGAHGELIMGALADCLDAQDSTVTTQAAREDRSYGAPEAQIEIYKTNASAASYATAIEDAATSDNGVDIIVISTAGGQCGQLSASPSIRDAWNLAYSLGAIGVLSAGNDVHRNDDDCTVNGWATRTDILVIGAFGDHVDTIDNFWLTGRSVTPIWSWVMDTQPLMGWHWTDPNASDNCANSPPSATCWSSALGGANLKVAPGGILKTAAWKQVDLVAPAGRELSARFDQGVASYGRSCCGTSQAAPDAASVVASVLDWAYQSQFSVFNNPGITHVNMQLMGDGARGSNDPGGQNTATYSAKDRLWGLGRLHARLFNDVGLDGPWAWGTSVFSISSGQTIDFVIGGAPINNDVDYWRTSMAWNEPNLDATQTGAAADIVLRVVTTSPVNGVCVNPNGTGGTTIVSDLSFDPEKHITIQGTGMASLWGKCAWMRVSAFSIPDSGTRTVFRADFFEDRDRESAENLNDID